MDDSIETYRKAFKVPSQGTEIEVLFGDKNAFICKGKKITARELFEKKNSASIYKDDFYFVDVDRSDTSYRAYFKKEHLISSSEATYIFCSGSGSELSGNGCMLAGVTNENCFESYIAEANTIEFFDDAIRVVHNALFNR